MKKTNKLNQLIDLAVKYIHRHRMLFFSIAVLVILYLIIKIFFTPPLLKDIHFSKAYFDRNDKLLRMTISADEKYRIFTPISEISPYIQQATILYEDKYFKYHIGINPVSLIKATINYFSAGSRQIGASTITMQVARLKYKLNTKNISGKLKQIAAAIYIDAFYSKEEILEAYLNLAPYGGNIEGIGSASLIYFEKPADKLSKIEAITLSTVPQNPVKRGLNSHAGLQNIEKMRKDLVSRWIEKYPADTNLYSLAEMPINIRTTKQLPFLAPHFVNHEIEKHNNYWASLGPQQSIIKTTLDLDLQTKLESTLRNEISKRKSIGVTNAAAILVNYKTMEELVHIGSADYYNKEIYGENDGVHARRSPGSTLKPLIYAAAVDKGYIHSMTLLKDAKISFGVYAPENADNEFYGPVLARDALTHSRNIPAINLLKQIGVKNFYNLLSESGVTNLKSPEHYGISIALGGAEVSMFELAEIYTTMANLGKHYKINTEKNLFNESEAEQILSPEAFFLVLDMLSRQSIPLRKIPFTKQKNSNLIHYWKTGTSSSFRDAWTAGIFGDYVLIVWVGNFDGQPNNSFSGAKTAAPIYFSLAQSVINYYSIKGEKVTNNNFYNSDLNISEIEMCDGVGGLAGKYCPKKTKAYFIPGKSPIETSSIYRAVPIDKTTGLRACTNDSTKTRMEVFEFWDAEYLDMFRRAGIKRKTPPPFMPNCNLDEITNNRMPPVILSPIKDTRIVITSEKDSEKIYFKAISDMPEAKIFWFLDNDLIGTSFSGQAFSKDVPMGEHTIRIIDEMGGAESANFSVIK